MLTTCRDYHVVKELLTSLSEFTYIDFIDLLCEISSGYDNFMFLREDKSTLQ